MKMLKRLLHLHLHSQYIHSMYNYSGLNSSTHLLPYCHLQQPSQLVARIVWRLSSLRSSDAHCPPTQTETATETATATKMETETAAGWKSASLPPLMYVYASS